MSFKRTGDKPLYLAMTKDEVCALKCGFGLRSALGRVETSSGRMHLLRGHHSAEAAAAAHRTPAVAMFHIRVRPQAIENLDHVALGTDGAVVFAATSPFALNLYEFEIHVPNVQTKAWEWLAFRYYGLAAADFDDLIINSAKERVATTAKRPPMNRAQWFAMMRRTRQLRIAARAA